MVFIWLLKFNLSSISIPKTLTAGRERFNFLISNIHCCFNICRLALIQQNGLKLVRINHHLAIYKPSQSYLHSCSSVLIKSSKVLPKLVNMLLSAYLWAEAIYITQKKLLKKLLKSIGPTMDPCGTPDIISRRSLSVLLILTHCFLLFKQE